MRTAILVFDAFNVLDSFIALGILNRIKEPGWEVVNTSPEARIQSMNGVRIDAYITIEEACRADAVLVDRGMNPRDVIVDSALMAQIQLNPDQQLIGAQCSGTLLLAKKRVVKRSICVYRLNDATKCVHAPLKWGRITAPNSEKIYGKVDRFFEEVILVWFEKALSSWRLIKVIKPTQIINTPSANSTIAKGE